MTPIVAGIEIVAGIACGLCGARFDNSEDGHHRIDLHWKTRWKQPKEYATLDGSKTCVGEGEISPLFPVGVEYALHRFRKRCF